MNFYSTNGQAPIASLEKAVVKGLAEDKGLYMPERIKSLPQSFFDNIQNLSFQEIASQEDLPLGTVLWRGHRALMLLRRALRENA